MSRLGDLTIVIPSFGRQDFLTRQISYWSASEVNLLILDGSEKAMPLGSLPSRVNYVHMPTDFFQRMQAAADCVTTPYVALLGDDDLYLPSGLEACIEHLERERRDVGAVGRAMYFFEQEGQVFVSEKNPESSNYPPTVMTGLDRLRDYYHPGKIGAIAYGVFRATSWKDAIRATYASRYSCGYVYDTFLRTTLTYAGNVSVVESVTWLCSGENPPIVDSSSFNRKLDLIDWLIDEKWSTERAHFKASLVDALLASGTDSRAEIERAVGEILRVLTERYTEKLKVRTSAKVKLKQVVVRIMPRSVKRLAKRVLPRKLKGSFGWQGASVSAVAEALRSRGISSDSSELKTFERLVLEFHQP